jgi:hypothetical protein
MFCTAQRRATAVGTAHDEVARRAVTFVLHAGIGRPGRVSIAVPTLRRPMVDGVSLR